MVGVGGGEGLDVHENGRQNGREFAPPGKASAV